MDLALDGVLRFDTLQKLVIDEFDEILNLGFRFQMISILSMMKRKRQNILLSATMTDEVDEMLNDYFDIVDEISLAPSGTPLEKIEQKAYLVPNFLTKINIIKKLLQEDDYFRILLFVNNKKIADLVFEHLSKDFENEFDVIHSNKSQNYRLNVLRTFQEGLLRGIITTDVMARGLDFKDVTHVFNIQFPEIAEQYIHRIGRTGRAEKTGIALSFITPAEEEIQFAAEILMEKEIEMIEIPENIEIALQKLEFEKEFKKVKQLIKTNTIDLGGGAFHEKKDKNKKVNLGGPGKRNPKKTKPTNRGRLKKKE
jgi:ATP-dependent RNA helicase RhlE